MRPRKIHCVLALFAFAVTPYLARATFYDPEDDRVIPLGALASGTNTVQLVGNDYVLKFVGDETIEYHIDRSL